MIKRNIISLLAMLILLVGTTYASHKKDQKYESPDGNYIAYVIALPKAPYGSGESKIIIKTKKGKTLRSKSYWSEDGEHGYGVEKAAWTPDSLFFVYSMSSSGGHQAWNFPTFVISMHGLKIRSLDDHFGPITDPDFELKSPDIFKTTGRDKATLDEANFEIRLNQLR
jgi:hypothetical protein